MSFISEICAMLFHPAERAHAHTAVQDAAMSRVRRAAFEQMKARRRAMEAGHRNERALKLLQDTLEGGRGDGDGTDDP